MISLVLWQVLLTIMVKEPFIVYAYQIVWWTNTFGYVSEVSNFVARTGDLNGQGAFHYLCISNCPTA